MDENFIPYEQIKPLLKPGMTFFELGEIVLAEMGLPHSMDGYCLQSAVGTEPMAERLRRGVYVRKSRTALAMAEAVGAATDVVGL